MYFIYHLSSIFLSQKNLIALEMENVQTKELVMTLLEIVFVIQDMKGICVKVFKFKIER